MNAKHVCKAERLSLDMISTVSETVLETILCLIPTKDAARTSILSREWRYKWTKIPKLEFWVLCTRKNMDMMCNPLQKIHQILLRHQGSIHEITFYIFQDYGLIEIDQIMLHLSRNHTVKKLRLFGSPYCPCRYKSSVSVSLHHLTDLVLSSVYLYDQPLFNGFENLRSLSLHNVGISTKKFLHLLSICPLLKSLSLETIPFSRDRTIFELFKFLSKIEHLTTYCHVFEWLVLDPVPQELPTSLFHLKYFCFDSMCFEDGHGLAFLLVLIKCSPNLEKIKLEVSWHDCDELYSVVREEYPDVWLEHLNELEIRFFSNSKPEMEFVKFILARSPNLKKVSLDRLDVSRTEKLEMVEVLLRAPRASPVGIYVREFGSKTFESLSFIKNLCRDL